MTAPSHERYLRVSSPPPRGPRRSRCARWAALAVLALGVVAVIGPSPAISAEEGDEDVFPSEPAIVRQLRDFKTRSGPLVPQDVQGPWASHFTATKGGARLTGAVWFEGDQLVVDAVVETEGRTFIPERLRIWDPKGRAYDALPLPPPPPPPAATQPADPSEPPVTFSFGVGVRHSTRRRHRHRAPEQEHEKYQEGKQHEQRREYEHYHERRSRVVPRVGINFTPPPPTRKPLAAMLQPRPSSQRRFPAPPCPGRMQGWSIGGAISTGPGRPLSLVAPLEDPPGTLIRTAPCQILVVMTIPPGRKGAETTMEEVARAQGVAFVRSVALPSIDTLVALMEVSAPTPLASLLQGLGAHPQVLYAQPNHPYRTAAYNDPLAGLQYGPTLIRADRAHRVVTGRAVSVAVIDTGIDGDHPDLRGKVAEQVDLIGPDPPGTAAIHGTLIAGVIGATENNGIGVFGVAPHVKLLGLKACQPVPGSQSGGACTSESIARALDLAIRRKVRIINMSLGGPRDRLVETLVLQAARQGIVVVASVGNDGPEAPPRYPAGYESVLAVSAVGPSDKLYERANVGEGVDMVAPGVDIVSTVPGERYNLFSGTSLATAHVSAVAALLLQARPDLSPAELAEALEATARDLGRSGRDPRFGAGRIDACRALERVTRETICP